jgi:hypothetical protein
MIIRVAASYVCRGDRDAICHWLDENSRDDALASPLINCLKL